jgi:hypothetical protein
MKTSRPKPRRKAITIRTALYRCIGGPLHDQVLRLSCGGTLSFTLNGMTGRYDQSMTWRAA